jgi:UDP-N-acetylglucosamine--N-acetylmuramyl-(pentapeptide) pyrophosphoryl-undecaprenol N-acetylglucosamine transferase
MKKILLTGGGSAGHVTPNLSLIESFQKRGDTCVYIGSYKGIERGVIAPIIKYYPIASGKIRRYFSLMNFIDPIFILIGFFQSIFILLKERPAFIFSKGGYVAPPVVFAAKLLGIKIYIHESDSSPGLATKLTAPLADTIFTSDPKSAKYLQSKYSKVQLVKMPIRPSLFSGDKSKVVFTNPSKPTLLVMGGSLGATTLNNFIKHNLNSLSKNYNIIHLTGKKEFSQMPSENQSYLKYDFVQEELPDLYAAADLILARAGATSLHEFEALQKKCLLVPLPKSQSRGEQIQNAKDFSAVNPAEVILDNELNIEKFTSAAQKLASKSYPNKESQKSILSFI